MKSDPLWTPGSGSPPPGYDGIDADRLEEEGWGGGPSCPLAADLIRLFENEVGRDEADRLETHIAACPRCRPRYAALTGRWLGEALAVPGWSLPAALAEELAGPEAAPLVLLAAGGDSVILRVPEAPPGPAEAEAVVGARSGGADAPPGKTWMLSWKYEAEQTRYAAQLILPTAPSREYEKKGAALTFFGQDEQLAADLHGRAADLAGVTLMVGPQGIAKAKMDDLRRADGMPATLRVEDGAGGWMRFRGSL